MIKVATYKYNGIDLNTPADMHHIAYIVLPNGEYWGVRFNGATEEIAKAKAISTWQHEQEKWKRLEPLVADPDPWADNQHKANINQAHNDKQHHRAGKVWMRLKETRELVSIPLTEIAMYEKHGFIRGGPRSK